MFEQIFKNIDDTFRKDSGCSTELDYAEQSSWILFLKWLDDYEHENKIKAELDNKNYTPILESEFQWNNWAVIKNSDGTVDHNKSLTGPDLKDFVDNQLFEYLKDFRTKAKDTQTIEYKIGEVFHELKNKLQDGYTLRDILDQVDKLKFNTNENKFELSSLYEDKIKNMGNAGRNGGEYYTPRSLINSIVKVINPKIGETVYDGAVGSAGFLVAAYENIKKTKLTSQQLINLQTKTLYGVEKKSLAYIIGLMNMMLHGIESPNLTRRNTLEDNISEIQDKDRFDIVLANPPFGGKEKANIQENFPLKTSETAYLFLQHFIKILKKNGRAGVVIKNTFLSNGDAKELRKQLLIECNLYAVLDLPVGTFQGASVKTVVLFFEKGKPTEKIWYYQLNLNRNLGKTNPLNEKDLAEFVDMAKTQQLSDNSWLVDVVAVNKDTWDLTVNNPNTVEEIDNRTPEEIIAEIEGLDAQAAEALQAIKELL
jgi:type I restriction enzyme M protein